MAGLLPAGPAAAQDRPLPLLDVPFISQSEALCGGAAAAMVLRFWGERGVAAESFAHLVDRSAAGIRTDALVADLRGRGWEAVAVDGREDLLRGELARGRPVVVLIEDRPGTYHYVVVVAWHERGVVFHDPARAPFRVLAPAEFDRRWRESRRWMAVVLPPDRLKPAPTTETVEAEAGAGFSRPDISDCDALIADGVRRAQANDLDGAERALTSALGCPGPAAARELAGVRLLQRRWPDVSELARAAVAADASDAYAWKLLATSRYIQEDRDGALEAWNHAGEPRVDLVRVDGLRRTRQRVVEDLVGVRAGEMLTPDGLLRARRRLAALPSAASTRLDYAPVPNGLAELRAALVERPVLPSSRLSLAALALSAAARREVRVASASPSGGGEEIAVAWRFWERRPRVAVDVRAPAPWGGLWGVEAYAERQPFAVVPLPRSERAGALLRLSNWTAGTLHVGAGTGVDRWKGLGTFGRVAGDVRWLSPEARLDVGMNGSGWFGGAAFAQFQTSVRARSSSSLEGYVGVVTGGLQFATVRTPRGMWPAGDSGHARATLLRAHPVLDDGRLRADRLGRALTTVSVEGQRWWPARSLLRVGAAAFVDLGRTSRTLTGVTLRDADAGLGARFAVTGVPGVFRVDLAQGLRDGATVLSFVYEP